MEPRNAGVAAEAARRRSNYETFYSQDGVLRVWEAHKLAIAPPRFGHCEAEIRRAYNA